MSFRQTRTELLALVALGLMAGVGCGNDKTSTGISCLADGVCQISCASDPDCASANNGAAGAVTTVASSPAPGVSGGDGGSGGGIGLSGGSGSGGGIGLSGGSGSGGGIGLPGGGASVTTPGSGGATALGQGGANSLLPNGIPYGCSAAQAALANNASQFSSGTLVACIDVTLADPEPTKTTAVLAASTSYPPGTYVLRAVPDPSQSSVVFMPQGVKLYDAVPSEIPRPNGEEVRLWIVCSGDELAGTTYYLQAANGPYPVHVTVGIYYWNSNTVYNSALQPGTFTCPASSGTGGSGNNPTPAAGGATGTSSTKKLCETPYRCNPATTSFNGLERKYLLESCNASTGYWSKVTDCSATFCTCVSSTISTPGESYASCRKYAGDSDCGARYTW